MRVVFMGTPALAAAVLDELSRHHEVVGVYTRPDAVRGRGKKLVASPVKELAVSLGLAVHEPRTLRDAAVQEGLSELAPDVICVAAYGALLPREVLDIPRLGCLNVHVSLLPRWRGAAPIERAILAGDAETGVCIMRMEEGLDTGDYCVTRSIPIEGKSSAELTDDLALLGARALITALEHLEQGAVRWTAQEAEGVTYAEKIAKGELDVDPEASLFDNVRRVRASSVAHPSRCVIADRAVTVLEAAPFHDGDVEKGRAVYSGKRLLIGCADGAVEVISLKPDGKKEMAASAFAAGCPALRSSDAKWGRRNG